MPNWERELDAATATPTNNIDKMLAEITAERDQLRDEMAQKDAAYGLLKDQLDAAELQVQS